jgi:CheY-like chemotaxis protein
MHQQSILVVDDELQARKGLAELLESRDYSVKRARSGKEAVKKAAQPDIVLILMDIKMAGELDGIEAVYQIQGLRPGICVIFVTAFSHDHEYQRRVQEANLRIACWIDKPIAGQNKKLLLSSIDEQLMKVQLRGLFDTVATQSGIERLDEIIKEVRSEISSPVASTKLLKELDRAIRETKAHFSDIQRRQFAFAQFRAIVMDQLWDTYQVQGKYHRQLAMLIRMSVRKLSSLRLTERHLEALESVLERLSSEEVTIEDVVSCRKTLQQSGIETVIKLGEKTDELLEIYDEGVMDE